MPGLLVVFVVLVVLLCVFIVAAHVALARWSSESRVVELCVTCCDFCQKADASQMAEYSDCLCGCTDACRPWRDCDCVECGCDVCCSPEQDDECTSSKCRERYIIDEAPEW